LSVKSFFDTHSHHHAYHKDPTFYDPIVNYLKKTELGGRLRILDLGCGDGKFIKSMIAGGVKGEFYGADISFSMINLAKEDLRDKGAELLVADGFKLPIKAGFEFDIIHIDAILHHLIGKTRGKSIQQVHRILDILVKSLSENGALLVEEFNFVSYCIPSITSFMLFYGLKLLNFLHLDVRKVTNEIQPGLEVNFFYDKQLQKLFEKYGSVQIIRKKRHKVSRWKHLFLLKETGNISYLVRLNKSR